MNYKVYNILYKLNIYFIIYKNLYYTQMYVLYKIIYMNYIKHIIYIISYCIMNNAFQQLLTYYIVENYLYLHIARDLISILLLYICYVLGMLITFIFLFVSITNGDFFSHASLYMVLAFGMQIGILRKYFSIPAY